MITGPSDSGVAPTRLPLLWCIIADRRVQSKTQTDEKPEICDRGPF